MIRRLAPLLGLLLVVASAAPALSKDADGRFDGTAALNNCSASIVRWTTSVPSDPALVLTNAHCHGDGSFGPREVLTARPHRRDVILLDDDGAEDLVTVRTRRLLYATMFKTDVALYRLKQTYGQLERRHRVSALTLAPRPPRDGSRLVVVSGYWRRTYRCDLDGFVHRLHEGPWDWWASLRYSDDGCRIIDGTSGSPVVHPGGRWVVGINNTYNEQGERCTRQNPCEEDQAGRISVHPGRGYGQQTWWLTTCVRPNRTLDLSVPGCRLPAPR